jgi:hypothetical protein
MMTPSKSVVYPTCQKRRILYTETRPKAAVPRRDGETHPPVRDKARSQRLLCGG